MIREGGGYSGKFEVMPGNPPQGGTTGRPVGIDNTGNVVFMTEKKTDEDIARELREEIAPHLLGVCAAMDKARAAGLRLEFNIAPDSFGRHNPPFVAVTKSL